MRLTIEEAAGRAQELGSSVVARNAERTDRDARWPEENFRALLDAGLGGLVVPVEAGGCGLGLLALSRVCEELAFHCASTGLSFGMHHVAAAVLAAKATADQRARYLEPIARGEHLTTLALSEPGTGAHFYLPETQLRTSGSGFIANGTKSFVTNGGHADSYVISTSASVAEDRPVGEFSCVIVPRDTPGLEWQGEWAGLGMRGNASRTVVLRDVAIEPEGLLGSHGDQSWYVFQVVAPYFLMAMSGTYLGVAAAALEEARGHLGERTHTHTGSSLARQPVLQARMGGLWARVTATRALIRHAAALGDAGHPDALPALCSAKAEAAQCAVELCNEAMTLLGGQGYRKGARIERLLRDARASHVMSPTTDLLRLWTGRAVLGLPLLAE